jgi:hypothetical protein
LTLPQDFEGELNLLLVAFQRWQQAEVDTWIPFAKQLEDAHPELRYYELPTIEQRGLVSRTLINEGMRAGIPDPVARERTITLYLDKDAFRQALGMPNEDHIYVLLLDHQGQVLWRAEGSLTPEQGAGLKAQVEEWQPREADQCDS